MAEQQKSAQGKRSQDYCGGSDNPASAAGALLTECRHRCFLTRLPKFLRHFGIAEFLGVKIDHRHMRTVFYLGITKVMQMPLPVAELFQIFRHVLGEQDVTGIAAIHHPLGNINSGPGNVGPTAYIHDAADRATMHTHAQFEFGVFLQRAADFERAFNRRFGGVVKYQGHTVARWNRNQPIIDFRSLKLLSAAYYLVEYFEQSPLLIDQQLGVADDVDEEHIGNLQLDLLLNLR